jgi:hypothetical protein
VLSGPGCAMRHDTNDESDEEDDDSGSKENIPFLEHISSLGNNSASAGCQPGIQW